MLYTNSSQAQTAVKGSATISLLYVKVLQREKFSKGATEEKYQ